MWQPWATGLLVASQAGSISRRIRLKEFETRSWQTDWRGPLLIHASKKRDGEVRAALNDPEILNDLLACGIYPADLAFGAIIGMVRLDDCFPMREMKWPGETEQRWGIWNDERFAWRCTKPVLFKKPIDYVGKQNFFWVPDSVVSEALREAA